MNILVINQPLSNRGDEAAHRALIRGLNINYPQAKITVFFSNMLQDSVNQMEVKYERNTYINDKSFIKGRILAKRFGLSTGLLKLSGLHPSHSTFVKLLQKADFILCAPGGPSIGSYIGWDHVYWLSLAKAYHKKIAYYSRSIGPFNFENKEQINFNSIGLTLLRSFEFLSLRDDISMGYADGLNLKYQRSIDTAFLDNPGHGIPEDVTNLIGDDKYIVFVPNSLTWAPGLKSYSNEKISLLFVEALHRIEKSFKGISIVMLPQLFNCGDMELDFFKKIQAASINNNVIIFPDIYSSDIQQAIISKSELVVGARYHSIVFAINQEVPFVALSYEHKIKGMLEYLNCSDHMLDLREVLDMNIEIDEFGKLVQEKLDVAKINPNIREKANKTARACLEEMVKVFPPK